MSDVSLPCPLLKFLKVDTDMGIVESWANSLILLNPLPGDNCCIGMTPDREKKSKYQNQKEFRALIIVHDIFPNRIDTVSKVFRP
jgi:hypothetical protein